MPQMLHVPGVALTSFGCIGQMYPLVALGMSLIRGRAVPGIISCPDRPVARDQHDRQRVTHDIYSSCYLGHSHPKVPPVSRP